MDVRRHTGVRRSELLGLTWPDLNLTAATVTVRHTLVAAADGYRLEDDQKSIASGRTPPPRQAHPGHARHPHPTLAPAAGVNPKVVSERLGHSSVAFTLDTTYAQVVPGMQPDAARLFTRLVFEDNPDLEEGPETGGDDE